MVPEADLPCFPSYSASICLSSDWSGSKNVHPALECQKDDKSTEKEIENFSPIEIT